jgi:hypothetical protein
VRVNTKRLVTLVLAVVLAAACKKEEPAAAPVVPATAAPEPVPATPPPDAPVAPDAASAPDAQIAPVAPAASPPRAPAGDPLFACAGDGDCSLLWLGRGCLPGDPMAVARAHEAQARKKYAKGPPIPCGIGGPKYEADRRAILARYAAACRARKCTLVDHGPQPTSPTEPGLP